MPTTVAPNHRHGATCLSPVTRMNSGANQGPLALVSTLVQALQAISPDLRLVGTYLLALPDPEMGSHIFLGLYLVRFKMNTQKRMDLSTYL